MSITKSTKLNIAVAFKDSRGNSEEATVKEGIVFDTVIEGGTLYIVLPE